MDKFYNLKQDNFENDPAKNTATDEVSTFQSLNKKNYRNNLILNGFIFLIGLTGFITAFMIPPELVYNRTSLEKSFTNNPYKLASSSLPLMKEKKCKRTIDWENHFHINGIAEQGELMAFEFDHFSPKSEVVYTIQFGNGEEIKIEDKVTNYRYPKSGKYRVKVIANYNGEVKELYEKKITIHDAIIVNSIAFKEAN